MRHEQGGALMAKFAPDTLCGFPRCTQRAIKRGRCAEHMIGDEQIRELKASPGDHETFVTCLIALGEKRSPGRGGKRVARARCAEIINARTSSMASTDTVKKAVNPAGPDCRHQECGPGPCRQAVR